MGRRMLIELSLNSPNVVRNALRVLAFTISLLIWAYNVIFDRPEEHSICAVLHPGSITQYLQFLVFIFVLLVEGIDLSFVWVGTQLITFIV